ncbi:alpha-mannosidase [Paenibacillus sp.]|uniref:alpha-mannosidase n=1 Tax=Paenibacillus sp. TaxID=58172 RepID=UPI002D29480A|nr:glycoside hydrolase family 38 C-terminal domain-containing protein [Paenibacillus sp.]HZG56949.1 glycoside hydrolase family 38 C-terminal domain-containing protein [Paenibacillus sp.]
MSKKTRHMIGNAHLDPVWLWQWQEGFQEVKATLRSALDRMKEYEDFVFTSSTAAMYEWVERNEPNMFREIRERVAEGRWVLCGGWWVQSDCNLPSGESFARQALYGQRYFLEKFGVLSTVGYNVDSFGHHAMLPQLLRLGGMDAYVFMRPKQLEKRLDTNLFRWESADGSSVLAYRIHEYCQYVPDMEGQLRSQIREREADDPGVDEHLFFYGVGNHGGGPTKALIESILELRREGDGAYAFSSPSQYFERVKGLPSIPVVRDELQMHAIGCYSAHSAAKRWNRYSENLLVAAERWAAVARRVTGQEMHEDLSRAWKNVLFNQFHDILPGSSIEAVYEQDARDTYGEANAIASRALNDALQSLSWNVRIEAEEGMKPIVAFNSHVWPVRTNVELEFGHFGEGREFHNFKDTDTLVDAEGREVPVQRIASRSSTVWRQRLCFVTELPPLGYRTFRVVPRHSASVRVKAPESPGVSVSDFVLENDRLRLELDPQTGWIASLRDKRRHAEAFRGFAAIPAVLEDESDTWSHDLERYDNEIGAFRATRIRTIEAGPVKSVIRVESEYGKSIVIQDFAMYAGLDLVEVNVTVDWRERFKLLKLRFPVDCDAPRTTYEIPYGTFERNNDGREVPGLSWFDQSGPTGEAGTMNGVSILNDGKYSFDATGNVMSITVLRSPIYAHDRGHVPREDGAYTFMDQGVQRFTYALLPHGGDWRQAETVRRAAELNLRPFTVIETYHEGALPQDGSFVSVDKPNVVVSAVKTAEDNDDLIVRCYETSREPTTACISVPFLDRSMSARFGPSEIKTFRFPADASKPVVETDFLELPDEHT